MGAILKRNTRWALVVLGLLAVAAPAVAQEMELEGQIRPRTEIRTPVAGEVQEFTSMRTRLGLRTALSDRVTAFIQVQDVRTFGEERDPQRDFSADGLDVHQAWVELGRMGADRWAARVGRQEVLIASQRIVGFSNWSQQARTFDGARLRFRPSSDATVDGIALRVAESDARPVPPGAPRLDVSLYGVHAALPVAGALDLTALLRRQTTAPGSPTLDENRYTLGARWRAGDEGLNWRLEGHYQLGYRDDASPGPVTRIRAFLAAARLTAQVNEALDLTVWYDYLSGDDDPTDATDAVFNTLYATNHGKYGFMDFFLNIPRDTNRRGLQDTALKARYNFGGDRVVAADLHSFFLAADDGLASGHLGEELDVTYTWGFTPGVTVTTGVSYFVAGDGWSVLSRGHESQTWGFVMLDAVF